MGIEIKVPELPESVADAVVASWYKQVGEAIKEDEVLVDLETDKVILEVPTVKQGVVKEILFSIGDTVTAGQLLAVIDESADVSSVGNIDKKIEAEKGASSVENTVAAVAAMSPSVRKLIAENQIDDALITGSGKNGRILKQDVEQYLKE